MIYPLPSTLRNACATHLRLGRVSNLPTIWSNCLAAWALAQGRFVPTLAIITTAMSLIYIGGMYLNDACDVEYDAARQIPRPIPNGAIRRNVGYVCAFVLLALGLLLVWGEGWGTFGSALGLVLLVIVYNLIHNRVGWSPVMLGGCRLLLYLTVGLAARQGLDPAVISWAFALALYVTGLSYLAKVEESNVMKRYLPLALTLIPPFVVAYHHYAPTRILVTLAFLANLGYSLYFVLRPGHRQLRRSVSGLLAGICLVDLLAVSQIPEPLFWQAATLGFFALTLFAQRFIPAT